MVTIKTTHVRINKALADELKNKFPGSNMPSLIDIMYRTSALRLEAKLRNKR